MTIFNIMVTKLNVVEVFDTEKLPAQSNFYTHEYGFRKAINDAHASITRENFPATDAGKAEYLAKVRKAAYDRIDQIRSGNVPTVRGVVDPWEAISAQTGVPVAVLKGLAERESKKAKAS